MESKNRDYRDESPVERVRRIAKSKGYSFNKLENELGYGHGSLGAVDRISLDRLYQISRLIGVPVYELQGVDPDPVDAELFLERTFPDRPEVKELFSLMTSSSKEDVEWVLAKLKKLRGI